MKLEDLEIVRNLGQGSFGKVKLCKSKKDGKYYALKCLLKD
jgi:serine/threonine protein kinase